MKAVFLDRDGVINELIYYPDHGVIDSPFTAGQFKLLTGVGKAITRFHELGYKVVIISNQPGMAKGYMSAEDFDEIRQRMERELALEGAILDGEYYCFHHPEARVEMLRENCECRKPRPGLLLQAATDMGIDLSQSWMIGDGLTDIMAGKVAGCRTVLLGRMKCELCHMMDEVEARPNVVVSDINEAVRFIEKEM